MLTFYKKYWRTAFDIGLIILTVYLTMLLFSYLYSIATPIFMALVIYAIIEPLALFLTRLGIKKSIAAAISALLFIVIIISVFAGASVIIASQISDLTIKLPYYQTMLTDQFGTYIENFKEQYSSLPPEVLNETQTAIDSITAWLTGLAKTTLNSLGQYLTSFSTFIFNFVIAIVLAYFLSIEINNWKKITKEKTPKTFKKVYYFLKDNVFSGIMAYLWAQVKLITITFVVIYLALLILKINNSLAIASLSALFDVLPLLGVATIFIPWIIYLFVVGNTSLAIWLTVLYVFVALTRQILEPKITGNTLGVSAFTMLSFMIISLSLFGVAGFIIAPILMILLKSLYDQGYFHKWIRTPNDEFDATGNDKG